jgi:hypothetical protein
MVHVHNESTPALLPIGRSQPHPMTPHHVCASGLDALHQSLQDRRDHPSSPPHKHRYPKINDSQVRDPNNFAERPESCTCRTNDKKAYQRIYASTTFYFHLGQERPQIWHLVLPPNLKHWRNQRISKKSCEFFCLGGPQLDSPLNIYLTASARDAGSSNVFK